MDAQESIPLTKRLAFRIAAQMLLVVVAALLLNAYLNYSNFDKTQRRLAESRILVSMGEVKRAVSGALELGLSLEELSNLGEILQRGLESGRPVGVEDLSILNSDGAVIASSSTTPPDWSGIESWPIERQQKETLRSLATDRFAIGMPLMNAFGGQSGWLVVAYNGESQLQARANMLQETLTNLLIAVVLAIGVLSMGVYVLTRPFLNGLQNIHAMGCSDAVADRAQQMHSTGGQLAPLATHYQRFLKETDALLSVSVPANQKGGDDAA